MPGVAPLARAATQRPLVPRPVPRVTCMASALMQLPSLWPSCPHLSNTLDLLPSPLQHSGPPALTPPSLWSSCPHLSITLFLLPSPLHHSGPVGSSLSDPFTSPSHISFFFSTGSPKPLHLASSRLVSSLFPSILNLPSVSSGPSTYFPNARFSLYLLLCL